MGLLTISFFLLWFAVSEAGELPVDRKDCVSLDAAELFFPKEVLGKNLPQFDEDFSRRVWYSQHLRAMGEPSLSCGESRAASYRFIWLRTFAPPIAVRIEIAQSVTLSAVELDGAGGYEPGKISRKVNRQLARDEWTTLSIALKNTDFWKMATRVPSNGLDGAQWILEGRVGSNYHVVDRWSPKTGAYRELCLLLVKLAGFMPMGGNKRDTIY